MATVCFLLLAFAAGAVASIANAATQHISRVAKRAAFVPGQVAGWYVEKNQFGQNVSTLHYCWGEPGQEQQKRWIQQALDETWHRLDVVKFVNVGPCGAYLRDSRGINPLTVSLAPTPPMCGSYFDKWHATVHLPLPFNSTCIPGCNTSTEEPCLKRAAVHEFGHALGLQHEQYRVNTPSKYEAEPCIKDRMTQYVIQKYGMFLRETERRELGPWDELSVMNYCGPDGSNHTNYRPLSLGDRAAVLSIYGEAAFFNSSCNSRNSKTQFSSVACQSAIQRYCEKVIQTPTQVVVGVLRNVTSSGLNVTCFTADYVEQPESILADPAPQDAESAIANSLDANLFVRKCVGSLGTEINSFKRYVGWTHEFKGSSRSNNPAVVCIESVWHGTLNDNDLIQFSQQVNDFRCQEELLVDGADGNIERYPLPCVALVDAYCEYHKDGSAGVIMTYDQDTKTMEIVCFQPALKIELLSLSV